MTDSIIGLIAATSGSPRMAFLAPMAWFHLPLATKEATVFRVVSTYLLEQYLISDEGGTPDWALTALMQHYRALHEANVAMAQRLRDAGTEYAAVNAVVLTDGIWTAWPSRGGVRIARWLRSGSRYARHARTGVDLRSIKAEMGMGILRAKSPAMIDKEIAAYLLGYNLVCALMSRAAAGAHVLARALSFKGTLQLLLAFEQQLRFGAGAGARTMTAHLLGAISRLQLPIRPDQVEPHAIKRQPKNYPLLTVPRGIARATILSSRSTLA
jgi:hypothetical protein